MPGILTRSSSNLNGNKFKTVLGIGSIQGNNSAAAYDAEHEDDGEDTALAARPSSPPPVKPRGRKLRARIPPDQRHPESTMSSSVDIKPNHAARPVRMDAQDGPWSVSVAEASPRFLTIYIKTPTHHLTLTRTAQEIAELHLKLQDQVPAGTALPPCPLEADQPQKRKSSFLTTLSRLASPPRQLNPQLSSPQDEITDPFLAAEPSATSALASYLTTLSNDKSVRVTRSWKRFVRVRTDDLESTRVERAIKRVRSDIAMHGGTNVPLISTTAPGSTCSSNASADDRPRLADRESSGFPGQSIMEEDEGTERNHSLLGAQPVTPDTASADEHARRLVASGMVDFTDFASLPVPEVSHVVIRSPQPRTVEAKPEPAAAKEPEELTNGETAKVEDEPKPVAQERQSRIPRSASADRDRASRRSRSFPESPVHPPQSETDAEVTEATDAEDTDAFGASATSDAGGPGPTDQPVKKKKKKQKLERKARKVVINDFEMMRVLGKGCAGKVLLVRHKRSQSLYALKAITKRHVLAHQELQHTMTEQAVLKRMARSNSDPFVVKLYWSFHDKENLFLVMDFHPGGDLATQLARWGRLGRDRARFYAAEIVEGCEGLHAAGVIYRDLKPENILIGGDGHIVLTDFGLSKEFPRKRPGSFAPNSNDTAGSDFYASSPSTPTGEKQAGMPYWMNEGNLSQKDLWLATKANDTTTTFCGTAEYLAPEVIQGLPYSYEVDWWSFGTMLYEMLTGITPFWANNHSDMYVRVLQDELTFPEDKAMDQDTKSLVRGLLQRNPALRLCEPRIKRHPYFSMIDWQHVYHKRYIPPYIPPIDPANASDTQNFDDAFLEMEPILDSEVENDDQTGSERDRSTTDIEPSYDEDSVQASPKVDSPATQPQAENDVFDGYSFKARNSVLIEIDDDAVDGGSDGSDEESIPAKEPVTELPEDEMDAGQKTPDAHLNVALPTPTPASAVAEAFRRQQESQRDATIVPVTTTHEVDTDAAAPTTPRNKVEELPAEAIHAPATPEKDLPVPPETAKTTPLPAVPAKEERKVVTISETPKPKAVTKAPRNLKPARRERSGVAALDRDLNDVIDEHDEMAIDPEDDDWDFVETPGGQENYKGQQVKSLFARGVVDRYRLKVFRKPSGTTPAKTLQRNASSSMSGLPMSESEFGELPDPGSPSPSDKKRKGGGGLSLRKGRTFLRPKSPSATYSTGSSRLSRPGLSTQQSATISGSSSGVLLTPSASTPLSSMPTNGTFSLKSQPSMNSVGSPGSSDTSVNGTRVSVATSTADLGSPGKSRGNKSSPDLRRQARESHTEGDESRQKGLKKMRKYTEQGAEKVMSLFSSPRPSPGPTQ